MVIGTVQFCIVYVSSLVSSPTQIMNVQMNRTTPFGMGQNWVAPNQGTNCAQGSCNHATGVMIGYDLDMIGVFPASVERRWQPMATDGNRWQLPGRIAAW